MRYNVFVNADDFGLNHFRNEGVVYAYKKNYIDKVSLVVNMPSSDEAVHLAKINDFSHIVGLHINLTEGAPLTENIKNSIYCDNDGYFVSNSPRSMRKVFSIRYISVLREEIEAQIVKFLNYGYKLNYLDFHNDILVNIPVFLAVKPLLSKYKVKIIRGVEPYLFGYYRKSILSYLPLKYYYMCHYVFSRRIGEVHILRGGRNINQYISDYNKTKNKYIGHINHLKIVEIITHPEMVGTVCIDRTNFDSKRNRFSIDNSLEKLGKTESIRISAEEIIKYL